VPHARDTKVLMGCGVMRELNLRNRAVNKKDQVSAVPQDSRRVNMGGETIAEEDRFGELGDAGSDKAEGNSNGGDGESEHDTEA
jgi:hypothetical protein